MLVIRTKEEVSKWERARDRFFTQNQWHQWPLCQLVPHQFEKVKSAPGRRCLARPHCRRSVCTGPNLQTLQPALPAEQARTFPHFTRLLTGGKSGSRWGVGLPAPKTPEKWGRWPRLALTVNQPAKGEERGVTEARRRREELARKGEGWQGVRCELSRETIVQQIYGAKHSCWVEAGCSYITFTVLFVFFKSI